MIRVRLEVGVKQFVAGGFGASARRLDSHEDRIDFRQNVRVLELEHPAILLLIVHIKDAEALRWVLSGPAHSAPAVNDCRAVKATPGAN